MNVFNQNNTLAIGSLQDTLSLSAKQSAKALVISDSHGYSAQIEFALRQKGKECDCMIFCGDGIGDLCTIIDRARVDSDFVDFIPPVIFFVAGNCDSEYYPTQDGLLHAPLTQNINIAGKNIFCTHGHRFALYGGTFALEEAAKRCKADIVLFGHTHVAQYAQSGPLLIANPGSCAKPRAGQSPCYATLSITKGKDYPEFTIYQIVS